MTPWGMVDLWMQAKYFIFCINNVVLLSFLNKSSLFKNFCLQFCQSIPWHTCWLMINFAPKTKRNVCIWDIARNLEPNFDKFFVLITWICFVNGWSCCHIRSCTGSLSRYTYTTVFTVKKGGHWTKILSIVLKCVQNGWNYLSNERFCMKFSLALESLLKCTLFSKLKTERNFNRQV